eukprot:12386-Prymnesium_polylepis.1
MGSSADRVALGVGGWRKGRRERTNAGCTRKKQARHASLAGSRVADGGPTMCDRRRQRAHGWGGGAVGNGR